VRGGLNLVEVESGDAIDVLQDPGQLSRHPLDVLVGQLEPRQLGDVQDPVAIDHSSDSRVGG
jgi:hypothetical protein